MNDKSNNTRGVDTERFEIACEWFLKLRETPESSELLSEWLTWCRVDERNRIAFEEVRALWWTTRKVQPLASVAGTVTPPLPATRSRGGGRSFSRRKMFAAAAALAVVVASALVARYVVSDLADSATVATFVTAQREHRSFQLADGSRVELAGDSRLTARLYEHRRQIELERGEAYFKVAHDATRPFVVAAGGTHVTAVGTSFNVRSGNDLVVVAVDEGVVVVEATAAALSADQPSTVSTMLAVSRSADGQRPIRLRKGEEVTVGVTNHELQVTSIEPGAVASWREGRLRFAREPLRSVVASVLASSGQEITLADPALGDLRFTGTVFSARVSDWVEGLPAIFPVTVRLQGETYVVERRD